MRNGPYGCLWLTRWSSIADKSLLASASCPCHPFADGGGAKRKSAIYPDLLQNKSALEGDVERRASLCAGVVHRNARMQFNENEAAALFHLEHA